VFLGKSGPTVPRCPRGAGRHRPRRRPGAGGVPLGTPHAVGCRAMDSAPLFLASMVYAIKQPRIFFKSTQKNSALRATRWTKQLLRGSDRGCPRPPPLLGVGVGRTPPPWSPCPRSLAEGTPVFECIIESMCFTHVQSAFIKSSVCHLHCIQA